MANINVGGRLHSAASGNVLAGADEILDDVNYSPGKKQSVVNAELLEAIGEGGAAVITNAEMDEVLGGDVAVYMTDSKGNLILDEDDKPIEILP